MIFSAWRERSMSAVPRPLRFRAGRTLSISQPVGTVGPLYTVETRSSTLRLRSDPKISRPVTRNVVAELPEGQVVRARGQQDARLC